jgi:hypothetical protein
MGSAALTAALLASCAVEPITHKVSNGSTRTIDLYSVFPGRDEHLVYGSLPPGEFYPINAWGDHCYDVVLIARAAGTSDEIDRRAGTFCPHDVWIVDGLPEFPSAAPEAKPTPGPT